MLTDRNIGIFSPELQNTIKNTRLVIVGCGMGSTIAELAIRTGFEDITIFDGDTVESTNLNRQSYIHDDIGRDKAKVLAHRLMDINPEASVRLQPTYLKEHECSDIVSTADLIIDTIDISSINVIRSLHRAARDAGVPLLFPLNLAWGSLLYVFTKNSATLDEMLGIQGLDAKELAFKFSTGELMKLWTNMIGPHLPPYVFPLLKPFLSRVETEGWCPVPQIGLATYQSAALTIGAAVKICAGESLRAAPEVNSLDVHSALSSL